MKNIINKKLKQAQIFLNNKEYNKAEKLLKEIKNKSKKAAYLLSNLYYDTNNKEEEIKLTFELAKKGDEDYQFILSTWYLTGENIEQNYDLAYKYLKLASKKHDPYATLALAEFYEEGIGTKKNIKKAIKWYKKTLKQSLKENNVDTPFLVRTANESLENIINNKGE